MLGFAREEFRRNRGVEDIVCIFLTRGRGMVKGGEGRGKGERKG